MSVSFNLHVHCPVCSKGTCFKGTFWSSISQMKNIEKGNLPVMKSTSEHVTDNCFRSHQLFIQMSLSGSGSWNVIACYCFCVYLTPIPEFGYCLVLSLYQKITPQRWHILWTAVHEICVNLWFATSVCSFFQLLAIFLRDSGSSQLFFFLFQNSPSTFYFTITQLLSCCWADRPKSCMSESVLGTGLMLHTVALGTAEGKVQCPPEGGCSLMPVWRWGGGCWLMCRRASRR